jgi:hypothetical protein
VAFTKRIYPAYREVFVAETEGWLKSHQSWPLTSVITSLPDFSEVHPEGGYQNFKQWEVWFVRLVSQILDWIPPESYGIFFQSDVRLENRWIDKSYLLLEGAKQTQTELAWRKIICRLPPDSISAGRPTFSHMLCFYKGKAPKILRPGPDVISSSGPQTWSRGMGLKACQVACRFLVEESSSVHVFDPFCGEGMVLATANFWGLGAYGLDISPHRVARSRQAVIRD